jgi:transposase
VSSPVHHPRKRLSVRSRLYFAACGLDMTRLPSVGHFASWAGACPGHHQSAGHRRSGRTGPGPRWLTDALTEAAKAAARTKGTYLAVHRAQLRGRRSEPKAIGAARHDIFVATTTSSATKSRSASSVPTSSGKRYSIEHRARRLRRQLEALGYAVTVERTERAPPA